MSRGAWAALGLILAALALGGCKRESTYRPTVEILRLSVIRKDKAGAPLSYDVEYSFVDCPGTQLEVVRGGKEFAACIAKHRVGDKVPLDVRHFWSAEGHYDYEVTGVADCERPPDANDEASYRLVRECEGWNVHGAEVGFLCRVKPEKGLLAKCPWFAKE